MSEHKEITQLLQAWRAGDEAARNPLFDAAYDNMHDVARNVLRGDRQRFVLQPTELVNECAMRMFGLSQMDWRDRAHFIAMATTTMRRILIDEARRKKADKRDGVEFTLHTIHLGAESEELDLEELDEVLTRLGDISPDLARVVELKYFGGLTNTEVAEVLDVSEATVKRSWRSARAWLYAEMHPD